MIKRILQIIDYKAISKTKFYKETGLSNGFLDKVKDIGVSKLELILRTYPEIDAEWLISGKGNMLKTDSEINSQEETLKSLINTQYFKAKDLMLLLSDNVKFLYVLCKILLKNNYKFSQQEKKKILFYDQLNKEYENVGMGKTALDLETYNHLEFLVREDLFGFVNNLIMKADEVLQLDITFELDKLFE